MVVVSLLLFVTSALREIDPSHHAEQRYRGDDCQVCVDFLPDEQSDLLLLDELCIVLVIVLDQLAQSDHGTQFTHRADLLHSKDEISVSRVIADVVDVVRQSGQTLRGWIEQEEKYQKEEENTKHRRSYDDCVEVRDVEHISLLHDDISYEVVNDRREDPHVEHCDGRDADCEWNPYILLLEDLGRFAV